MGSSGSGSFSDYSGQQSVPNNSMSGGASQVDKCNTAFATSLEEVGRCSYYQKKGLPPKGAEVFVVFNKIRLTVADVNTELEIGYLPNRYNYLKNCLDNGYAYRGIVQANAVSPTPSVLVDFVPA